MKMRKIPNILFIAIIILFFAIRIYLSLNLYIKNYPIWGDEMLLSQSITAQTIFKSLIYLPENQTAPPLFIFFTYLLTSLFGINSYILRFISFAAGILSLFAFLFLAFKLLKNKLAILTALFLFVINIPLLYYTNEFKQYSSDVVISLALIISYNYISRNLTVKKTLLYCLIAFLSIVSAFPSLYIILLIIVLKLFEEKIHPKQLIYIISTIVCAAGYVFFVFKNCIQTLNKLHEWQEGYLSFTLNSLQTIFSNFFSYYNFDALIGSIFLFIGVL